MPIQLIKNLGQSTGLKPQAMVRLTWQERQRARLAVVLSNGDSAAILLPRGEPMRDGDLLASQDNVYVGVENSAEDLFEITAPNAIALMRLIYHIANRHTPLMLSEHTIWIEPDPVLADLVGHLGGKAELVYRPFQPELGAYHGSAHHHERPSSGHSHGELDDEDRQFGNIGEALSRAAHAR